MASLGYTDFDAHMTQSTGRRTSINVIVLWMTTITNLPNGYTKIPCGEFKAQDMIRRGGLTHPFQDSKSNVHVGTLSFPPAPLVPNYFMHGGVTLALRSSP
ncbi:14265_t:CDS:2 [Ambispora leptoticha]|uniref:14265_t:CDS:1 n=1 Tax=Ambispora leptoticha TaxID=144679 RepID=A0A9N9GST6_9GLOM|nr:14265_t:CDS:2 [Ambispora leptoticha]